MSLYNGIRAASSGALRKGQLAARWRSFIWILCEGLLRGMVDVSTQSVLYSPWSCKYKADFLVRCSVCASVHLMTYILLQRSVAVYVRAHRMNPTARFSTRYSGTPSPCSERWRYRSYEQVLDVHSVRDGNDDLRDPLFTSTMYGNHTPYLLEFLSG